MDRYTTMLDAHLRAGIEMRGCRSALAPEATPEQEVRCARVSARALEVFGNRIGAGVWCHSPNERACGRWTSPWLLSRESEDGCCRVLIELDRIESTLGGRHSHFALHRT